VTQVRLPPAEYYATLPKQITGAGVIIRDVHNRVLLVETTYGAKLWEIPGGGLNDGEYPFDAARREVKELGLDILPGQLLVVDWIPPQPDGRPALTNYLFDGGILTDDQIASLHCADSELERWKYCTREEYEVLLPPHMVRRVNVCLDVVRDGRTAYLHHGVNPLDAVDAS